MTADRFSQERQITREPVDFVLLAILVLLVGVGLSTLFSSSYYYAQKLTGDPHFLFRQQLVRVAVGCLLALVLSRVSVELLRKTLPLLLLLSFVLMIFSFVPGVGLSLNESQRWVFVFGFSFQPSELVKFVLILYLAHLFSKKAERINDVANTVVPPLIVTGIFIALVYLQNDFSTAIFLAFIALVMMFVAGVKMVYFFLFITVGLPLTAIFIFTKEYRVRRIISYLVPEMDPSGTGFQVIAAKSALGRGGFWGSGIGLGTKKLGGLPEAHSDFVFAVLGEEIGYIGILFVLLLFGVFAVRGYKIAVSRLSENSDRNVGYSDNRPNGEDDRFGYLLAFGFTTSVLVQALFNTAVVSGLVPTTGIPLPFFSHGGSSIMMTLCMCGVLLNLSRQSIRDKELGYE